MADTQGDKGIERWQKVISAMQELNPATVIPFHFLHDNFSPAVLGFMNKYLADYRQAAARSKDAAELISAMEALYPQLAGREDMSFSAKVFKGEENWKIFSPYPPIGRAIKVDFGASVLRFAAAVIAACTPWKGITIHARPRMFVRPRVTYIYMSHPPPTPRFSI